MAIRAAIAVTVAVSLRPGRVFPWVRAPSRGPIGAPGPIAWAAGVAGASVGERRATHFRRCSGATAASATLCEAGRGD